MRLLFLSMMALLLTGCHRLPLSVRSEYLYPSYLSSEQINTPDQYRQCFYGQQIVVRWNLPTQCTNPLDLHLTVRYGTREIEEITIPLQTHSGYGIFRLLNEDYWSREGIISYKAEIYQNSLLLETWQHHLWSEIIEINN